MTDYRQLAIAVLKKVKGYTQNIATDEPQVLAWAENFEINRCDDPQDLLDAVAVMYASDFAKRPGFIPAPQMVSSIARERRADRRDRERHDGPPTPELMAGPVRGRYQPNDPAGWQYGCPTHEHKPGELEGLKTEIETRVAQLIERRPDLTPADAEREIRERDRERAEKYLANIGRFHLANTVGRTIPEPNW